MAAGVLDASMAIALAGGVPDGTPTALGPVEIAGRSLFLAPAIWSFEVANVLATAERRGDLDQSAVTKAIDYLKALRVMIEHEAPGRVFDQVRAIATRWDLSVYDAAYLELALREDLPLATLDKRLAKAATAAGLEVW